MKLILLFCMTLSFNVFAKNVLAQKILEEYNRHRSHIQTLTPDFTVDGHMMGKYYPGMELLWMLENDPRYHEVIRFYRERSDGMVFTVTYHRSQQIISGRTVIRRFIGTEPTGWINHTVDYDSGEYLGSQGEMPVLSSSEQTLLRDWNISYKEI